MNRVNVCCDRVEQELKEHVEVVKKGEEEI